MARFDLYESKSPGAAYLLDVQADFLSVMATRLVIPVLTKRALGQVIPSLHVPVTIRGKPYFVATNLMAAVPARQCSACVGTLAAHSHTLVAAIDFLLQGF